jgi:prevent-host-death family protein
MEVGVRRAKAELSKLIEAAPNGERVVITNHGKELVEIIP